MFSLVVLLFGFYLQNILVILTSLLLIIVGTYLCHKGKSNKKYRFSKKIGQLLPDLIMNKDGLIAVIMVMALLMVSILLVFLKEFY
jgi:hypothetical protein